MRTDVNIIAERFDNMAVIEKWYFGGNIWRDDLDQGIIIDLTLPEWLKKGFGV